jgi:microcystin-dependent protein
MNPYIGQILMVGFNFAPQGWALCNGQTLSIAQNTALFSLIGTYYGGDGIQTFMLPNLQGRVPVHQGQSQGGSPYVIGQVGGSENVTLLQNNMPIHNHLANCNNGAGPNSDPTNGFWAEVNDGQRVPTIFPSYGTSSTGTMNSTAIGNAGGSQPFQTLPPYQCVNFIIALAGIFPSRG